MVWYVRVRGKRTRIRETYGTPQFDAAYQAALSGASTQKRANASAGNADLTDRPIPGHGRVAARSYPGRPVASVRISTNRLSPHQAARLMHA